MSKKIKNIKSKIRETIDQLDEIVVQGGKVRQDDPLMIKLIKLRRELIKTSINKQNAS